MSKKKHKKGSTVKKLAFGALLGASFTIGFLSSQEQGLSLPFNLPLNSIAEFITSHILYLQIITSLIFILPSAWMVFRTKQLLKDKPITDEEAEVFDRRVDGKINTIFTLDSIFVILHFLLFGIALDGANPTAAASIIFFIAVLPFVFLLDLQGTNMLKEKDSTKNFHLLSNDFEYEYLNTCDESEKEMIFKTAYSTFVTMKMALLIAFVITLVTKQLFDTGNYPVVLVGMLWLTHTVTYLHNAKKNTPA